jgi:hypothetical protein
LLGDAKFLLGGNDKFFCRGMGNGSAGDVSAGATFIGDAGMGSAGSGGGAELSTGAGGVVGSSAGGGSTVSTGGVGVGGAPMSPSPAFGVGVFGSTATCGSPRFHITAITPPTTPSASTTATAPMSAMRYEPRAEFAASGLIATIGIAADEALGPARGRSWATEASASAARPRRRTSSAS